MALAETATKPSLAPFYKHSPGGAAQPICPFDLTSAEIYRFGARHLVKVACIRVSRDSWHLWVALFHFCLCKVEYVKSGSENVLTLIEATSNRRLKSMTDDINVSSMDSLSASSDSAENKGLSIIVAVTLKLHRFDLLFNNKSTWSGHVKVLWNLCVKLFYKFTANWTNFSLRSGFSTAN